MYIFPFILQTLAWIPTRLVLAIFVHFRVEGLENLSGLNSNAIIVANHQSELDPILVPASLNPFTKLMPMFYTARGREFYNKQGFMKYFYGGVWFKFWGAYQVYTGKKNYEVALANHINILNSGKTILVFPEGAKTKDGTVGKGKGGAVYLSHKTQTPIIPLAMKGHFKMTVKDFLSGKRTITLMYGKPMYPKNLFDNKNIVVNDKQDDYISIVDNVIAEVRKLHSKIL